jgi:hypothetical protein
LLFFRLRAYEITGIQITGVQWTLGRRNWAGRSGVGPSRVIHKASSQGRAAYLISVVDIIMRYHHHRAELVEAAKPGISLAMLEDGIFMLLTADLHFHNMLASKEA